MNSVDDHDWDNGEWLVLGDGSSFQVNVRCRRCGQTNEDRIVNTHGVVEKPLPCDEGLVKRVIDE